MRTGGTQQGGPNRGDLSPFPHGRELLRALIKAAQRLDSQRLSEGSRQEQPTGGTGLIPPRPLTPRPSLLSPPTLQVQKALIDMENMFELLHTKPNVQDPPGGALLQVWGAGRGGEGGGGALASPLVYHLPWSLTHSPPQGARLWRH